jgi:hypothetical protein
MLSLTYNTAEVEKHSSLPMITGSLGSESVSVTASLASIIRQTQKVSGVIVRDQNVSHLSGMLRCCDWVRA